MRQLPQARRGMRFSEPRHRRRSRRYRLSTIAGSPRLDNGLSGRRLDARLLSHHTIAQRPQDTVTRRHITGPVICHTSLYHAVDAHHQHQVPDEPSPRASPDAPRRNYLADAMLAVAALHLRSFNPDDKDLARASHSYMASSLSAYCASLNEGINESNAEALFLTATLIAFQSSASRIFIRDDANPADPSSVYTLPLSWFHAFQGVKTVVASSWPWLRSSGIVIPIIDSQPVLQLDLDGCAPTSFFGHLLADLDDELATEPCPVTVMATKQTYLHAVAVLNWAHKIPHRGAALAFPATVSKRFLDLIEARRPRALVVLACFFACLKSIENVWWLHGAARREVMGIVSQFEAASPWWAHLEWPVRIALYDGAVIPPDVWGADWVTEEGKTDKGSTMLNETFVNHIEILAGMLAKAQSLPPIPIPGDAVLG
ncbi:conserved hypothetical protein [Verticillium alfalfae VaMs.102]|uniref:C6 zinc finger domain-containing protein n=1 Tax=Verticillium alfalfae (strain VaMs.102 / ATCC MYA-4576 / FGSC 10136) TaxID=526221 RepID=C9SMM6_VERA1|nr:conserved hypothetical protein [Verticillium alfalfae VaMs.102]EEY20041.1 conserved hypothetical protein [Verticillium alfalfae VaMs.102]